MKRSQENWSKAVKLFKWLFALTIIVSGVVFAFLVWTVWQWITFETTEYSRSELVRNVRITNVVVVLIWLGSVLSGCFISGGIYFAAKGKLSELIEAESKEDLENG